MMMPCAHVIARLWEYIDGELDAASAAEVSAHLEMCSRCFPQYDYQRAYREFVRRTHRQQVPAALRRRVFEAILAQDAEAREAARTGWLSRLWRRVAG
ncbi:MAG: zf-HC2 domain-containing protein [Gemmatimonadetes bacterium]|nr:zf-HC2 domain-containing protein [Gemmatimonadota bacterium]